MTRIIDIKNLKEGDIQLLKDKLSTISQKTKDTIANEIFTNSLRIANRNTKYAFPKEIDHAKLNKPLGPASM